MVWANIPHNRHLLIGHRSYALPAGGSVELGKTLAADADLPESFILNCGPSLTLETCPANLLINGEAASEGQTVSMGDQLSFTDSLITLQAIEVG